MHPFFDRKMRPTITIIALFLLAACTADQPDNSRDVRIVRDQYGVPHVYAESIYGLYYGYGYAIAQDRLFQMEMARRSTQGTVAEVLGSDYVEYDKNARTLFSPASIQSQLAALGQEGVAVEGSAARAALFLVSQDFLDSNFIREVELPDLLKGAAKRGVAIFWVALRASTIEDYELVKFQCANDPDRPLDSLRKPKREAEMVQIARKLKKAVDKL